MNRIDDHPGLSSRDSFTEIAYSTGDADWPRARVRVTPMAADQDDRLHQPNAAPVPPRIEVRLSASLIDEAGSVERIAGKLLLGPESVHSWQFDAGAAFEADAWLDSCAARVIEDLLKQARGISAAAAAGLLLN
ncbi:MAG: hypothetical protein MUF47_01000 [Porphyrobacter sp.]|jgi:hypothetical protein|nr:hypothetical protein [Porphyrobacter sp.]